MSCRSFPGLRESSPSIDHTPPALSGNDVSWKPQSNFMRWARDAAGRRGARPGTEDEPGRHGARPEVALALALASAPTALHIDREDWDSLMQAVVTRLQMTVDAERAVSADAPADSPADSPTDGTPPRVRDTVLECVEALQQLRASRMHENAQTQRLEQAVFDANIELALTRAQLVGTQAEARRARYSALHDPLTALPNRTLFRTRLDQALARALSQRRPIAVLYLDLDDFKPINDVHGHDTGDQLLQIVALRLRRALRPEDTVSRVGGDEFACLLADVPSRQQLSQLVCKLFDTVSGPLKIGSARLTVRPSIGVAEGPFAGATSELLLKQADEAMYHAKSQRTGYAFFPQREAA